MERPDDCKKASSKNEEVISCIGPPPSLYNPTSW